MAVIAAKRLGLMAHTLALHTQSILLSAAEENAPSQHRPTDIPEVERLATWLVTDQWYPTSEMFVYSEILWEGYPADAVSSTEAELGKT